MKIMDCSFYQLTKIYFHRACLVALAVLVSCPANAREIPLSDDDLLIVAAKIGRLTLSTDLFIYYQPDFTLIPLQSLCDILDFAIEVDPDGRSASGWFVDESQTFNLNLTAKTLYVSGEAVPITDNLAIAGDDFDIYIDISALRQWFNLQLELVTSQLVLEISSKTPLPVEQRLAREKNRQVSTDDEVSGLAAADIKNSYQLFSLPVVDAQILLTHDKFLEPEPETEPYSLVPPTTNTTVTDSATEVAMGNNRAYNFEIGADFLYHQMSLSASIDEASDSETIRLMLSKRAKDFGESLWLGLSEYNLGDVYSNGDTLVNKGSSGVGLTFQRGLDGGREPNFTEKLIEGDAPPGWEVELYRNGVLIDFQVSDDSGRYRFEGAKLQFGENVFDVKIYGPQGQERNTRQRVHVGKNMIKPKEWTYRGSVMKENDTLFGNSAPTLTETDNASVFFDYGLNKGHSLGLGFSESAPTRTTFAHSYMQVSLLSAWSLLSTSVELANDFDSGTATQLAASTRLWNQDFTLEQRLFSDYFSQHNPNGSIKSQTNLNWSSYLPITQDSGIPLNLGFEQTHFNDGSSNFLAKTLMSGNLYGVRLTNELNINSPSTGERNTRGSLNINFVRGSWRSRSTFAYDISPQAEPRTLTTTLDWQGSRWRYQVNLDIGLNESETDSIGINISRRLGFGSVSFSGSHDENGLSSAQMSWEMSFGAKRDRPWAFVSPTTIADKGRVRAQVFIDRNNNNSFEANIDEPLSGIKFLGRKEWSQYETDNNGVVELQGFNTNSNSRLTLEEKSFNDPYLRPIKPSLLVSHHGGGYYNVTIPVRAITDVEGYVYLLKDQQPVPAAGVSVVIVDQAGDIVKRVKTEFDGYYYVTGIPEGSYRVELEDRIQNNSDYTVNTPIEFEADSELGIVEVDKIVIEKVSR